MSRRLLKLGVPLGLVLAVAPGCRSLQSGRFGGAQAGGLANLNPGSLTVRDHIARHNEAAVKVTSLKVSDLNVQVQAYQMANGREHKPSTFTANSGGYLLVQRPRNLKLNLRRSVGGEVADIGSNPQEFWMSNAMERQMLVGRYDEVRNEPLAAAIQPEWIMEILGIQQISPNVPFNRGKTPGTVVLTESRPAGGGEVWTKETVLSESDGRLLEHSLYTQDRKLIAKSVVKRYKEFAIPALDATGTTPDKISLPESLTLHIPNMVDLDLTLRDVQVNPAADAFPSTAFNRPTKEGYAELDIRQAMAAERRQMATDRTSDPEASAASDSTIRLSDPEPARESRVASNVGAVDLMPSLASQPPARRASSRPERQVVEAAAPSPEGPDMTRRQTWRIEPGSRLPTGSPEQ
jgi:hypothetical protein